MVCNKRNSPHSCLYKEEDKATFVTRSAKKDIIAYFSNSCLLNSYNLHS